MSIRSQRIKAGMTASAVAEKLGVTRQAVFYWEAGINDPQVGKLVALADLFGCTVDELLREDGKNENSA